MAGEQQILREYLISLGFKIDQRGEHQLGQDLAKWDKQATLLAKSLVGVATAAQVMVTEFAFRMERLFYSSKLAESAAGNLQALDFGAQQVGIKDFTGLVMNLARAIRGNPGLQGLLHSLGVQTEGRDKADVLKDLVKTLTAMPHYIGQRIAALFGIDPDQLLLLKQGMADMERFAQLRADMAKDLGVDVDKAAIAGREYAQQWREILNTVGLLRDALSLTMLPVMREMAGVAQQVLRDWIGIVREIDRSKNGPQGITEKGAAQSGLTVDEQTAMAMRAPHQKTWTEMTPDERFAAGMGVDAPRRKDYDRLTPDEREKYGIKEMPWWMKIPGYAAKGIDNAMGYLGMNPLNRQGVELSTQSKERLGYDRTRSTPGAANGSLFARLKDSALDALDYRSTPKTPMDPAAIEVATAPDTPAPAQAQAVAAPTQPPTATAQMLADLEKQKGLRAGVLDYIWKTESGRSKGGIQGPPTATGERAQGPFQFMKGTADQYGLKDPQSLPDSAKAAASYMHDLVTKYGDMRFALAAYNWGSGNLDKLMERAMREHPGMSQGESDKYVLGHLPEETRKYVNGYSGGDDAQAGGAGVTINADTKISVTETSSAAETARMVAANQQQVWGDIARQFAPKFK